VLKSYHSSKFSLHECHVLYYILYHFELHIHFVVLPLIYSEIKKVIWVSNRKRYKEKVKEGEYGGNSMYCFICLSSF
jgi:hypothetical protein